jgi:asparagine N-glycosylation enzyme membrane subunit Stt3
MMSLEVTASAAGTVFVSCVLGMILQCFLPSSHTTDLSRDIIGGVVRMLVLLLALVLGLLLLTAYGIIAG